MPPAPLLRMSATGLLGSTESSGTQGDALLPVMSDGGVPDPVTLATWHLALAAATAVDIPNDLFALWLFPPSGGAVLLGPEALAQDRVEVPLPDPQLLQDQLYGLEEILRRAKYASAIAVPIRRSGRDVGVMLLGSFARGAFGPAAAAALYRLAARLAPGMARLADSLPSAAAHASLEPVMTMEALPEHLARATCEAVNGSDLIHRLSGILYPLLPHDRLEILLAGRGNSLLSLSGGMPRRRWNAGSSGVDPFESIVARFGDTDMLVVEDLAEIAVGGEWSVGGGGGPVLPARSVLGVRLRVAGEVAGYLLLGSVARDTYRPDDEDVLALAGLIVAPRVAALRAPSAASDDSVETAQTLPLRRAAELLAGTAHLGEALAAFAGQLEEVVPHRGISLHLRSGEEHVIALDPRAPRPLADLAAVPLEEFFGAPIFRGERDWVVRNLEEGEEIVVALRVAGRTVGTLGIHGAAFESPRTAAALARQFADVLAPHLELLRRTTVSPVRASPVGRP